MEGCIHIVVFCHLLPSDVRLVASVSDLGVCSQNEAILEAAQTAPTVCMGSDPMLDSVGTSKPGERIVLLSGSDGSHASLASGLQTRHAQFVSALDLCKHA